MEKERRKGCEFCPSVCRVVFYTSGMFSMVLPGESVILPGAYSFLEAVVWLVPHDASFGVGQ